MPLEDVLPSAFRMGYIIPDHFEPFQREWRVNGQSGELAFALAAIDPEIKLLSKRMKTALFGHALKHIWSCCIAERWTFEGLCIMKGHKEWHAVEGTAVEIRTFNRASQV